MSDTSQSFLRLVDIMATLRSPQGCPWDAEQTPETLRPYLVEETYEVLEAIDHGDSRAIREELGDLLLQVVFLSRLFEEREEFNIGDVADTIADKLVRRHPHVFADAPTTDIASLNRQWNLIKEREKQSTHPPGSILHGVSETLPALMRARKLLEKASRAGFAPPRGKRPTDHIHAGITRLESTLLQADPEARTEAIGDILLAVADLARQLDVDAEDALRRSNNVFGARVEELGQELSSKGLTLRDAPPDTIAGLWAKTAPRSKKTVDRTKSSPFRTP